LPEHYKPFSDPKINQAGRLEIWADPSMFIKIKPFLSGELESSDTALHKKHITAQGVEAELEVMMRWCQERGKGYELHVFEGTHEALVTLGYHSVRVVIPQLIPLYLNEIDAVLGASRIREIPRIMGLPEREALNPWPHPFP
jgi:hypothetical protein